MTLGIGYCTRVAKGVARTNVVNRRMLAMGLGMVRFDA